jgi:ribosomal subunit interface protein
MDLIVKGIGGRVSGSHRSKLERKFAKLERHEPKLMRAEVHLTWESKPSVNGGHHVEASCSTTRHTFHARGSGTSLEAAIDQMVERLDRQMADFDDKRRRKLLDGANRVKSAQFSSQPEEPIEDLE